MSAERYVGIAGLARLREPWRELLARRRSHEFYHRWEWYDCYLRYLMDEPEALSFVVVREGGKVVAIVPLQRLVKRHGPLRLRLLQPLPATT